MYQRKLKLLSSVRTVRLPLPGAIGHDAGLSASPSPFFDLVISKTEVVKVNLEADSTEKEPRLFSFLVLSRLCFCVFNLFTPLKMQRGKKGTPATNLRQHKLKAFPWIKLKNIHCKLHKSNSVSSINVKMSAQIIEQLKYEWTLPFIKGVAQRWSWLHLLTNMQNYPLKSFFCNSLPLYQAQTKAKKPKTFASRLRQAWATAARWTGWTPTGRSSGCGSAWLRTRRCRRSALWCCDPACASTAHEAGKKDSQGARMKGTRERGSDVRATMTVERNSLWLPVRIPSCYLTSHALHSSTCDPTTKSVVLWSLLFTVIGLTKKKQHRYRVIWTE